MANTNSISTKKTTKLLLFETICDLAHVHNRIKRLNLHLIGISKKKKKMKKGEKTQEKFVQNLCFGQIANISETNNLS